VKLTNELVCPVIPNSVSILQASLRSHGISEYLDATVQHVWITSFTKVKQCRYRPGVAQRVPAS
jgi:hypothetical protein